MNKPLRVAMVVHAYYLRDARVMRYGEALVQAGHRVTVICLQAQNEPFVETVNGVEIHRVQFERRRGGKLWYILEYVWAFILFFIKLTALEFRQHFDIVHVHNMPDFLVFTGFFPRLRGAKLILDLHDPMPELFMSKYDLERGTIIRILEIEERVSCWYADWLITVDQSFKDIFARRKIPGDKITIVRNMPDDRLFALTDALKAIQPPLDRFVLIFAGTIAERYRITDVIHAVKKAQPEVPNILLRLVGKLDKEGCYTEELWHLTHELQLEDVVEFLPPVPVEEIPKLYRQAHLGLEPSRHDPYTDYVLPLKLLECVALEVPCLVSRRPTIESYFADEDVAYFEPGDIGGMAVRIVELAQSPEKLRQLAVHSKCVLERYNWSYEKSVYFDLLASFLKKRA